METKIRNATLLDLSSLLDFAKSVGRFVSADELKTWLHVDPEAIFVAEALPGGKLIGSCSGMRLTSELGFMGLYVVLEEFRGKGIGLKLWKAAKEHLRDRNIGVRGDPVNFKKYTEKDGFCHVEEYTIQYYDCFDNSSSRNIVLSSNVEVATYFEGKFIGCSKKFSNNDNGIDKYESNYGSGETESGPTCKEPNVMKIAEECFEVSSVDEEKYNAGKLFGVDNDENLLPSTTTADISAHSAHEGQMAAYEHQTKSNADFRKGLERFQEIPFNSMTQCASESLQAEEILCGVFAFDKSLHKRDRSFIVRQTFSWASCRTKVALMGGKVVGYACLRSVVTEHWLISPFYADTEDVAETLLFELLQGLDFSQAPKGIQIRFPDKNIACKRLVEKFGFGEIPIGIMTGFTKQCMNIDTSKVYSFHSTVFCSD